MARAQLGKWLLLGASLLALFFTSPGMSRAAPKVSEGDVKAAFLYNFAKFVKWPASSFASPQSPLTIGVVGDSQFAKRLEGVVRGEQVSGRTILVRHIDSDADLARCHVLFVSSSSEQRASQILAAVEGTGVLTVGQTPQFARHGGIIRLYIEDGRGRFEINPQAATRAGLQISSNLLALAIIVNDASSEAAK